VLHWFRCVPLLVSLVVSVDFCAFLFHLLLCFLSSDFRVIWLLNPFASSAFFIFANYSVLKVTFLSVKT